MKNKSLLQTLSVAVLMFGSVFANGQGMAVNTSGASANGSAMLDVSSTTQGMLVPRMTTAQRNAISSPATGLLIYQTDGTAGFYFYNGSAWTSVSGGTPTGAAGGDLTGTYPNPSLGASGVSPATYGSSTQVPVITVDSKGRITSGSTTAITGVTPGGGAGGDLTGTYPNPTIASLAVTGAKIANNTVTVGKISATGTPSTTTFLRGDGSWSAPSGGGGSSTLDLVAYTNSSITLPAGAIGSGPAATQLTFNNTITAPTVGSFDGTTYTAGASGTYLIQVSVVTSGGGPLPVVYLNGSAYAYGAGALNNNTIAPNGRGQVYSIVHLATGNTVSIKCSDGTQTAAVVSTDGTTQLNIVKL